MCFKAFFLLLLGCSLNATISNAAPFKAIQNQRTINSFDSTKHQEKFIISNIFIVGNKITKPAIIIREILFHEGDTIAAINLPQLIKQSRENLLNTALFNFVTIDTSTVTPGKINISIDVIERWYIWPAIYLKINERNFNVWWKTKDLRKIDYGIALSWLNFRGRNESLDLLVRNGFDESFGLSYHLPNINKSKTLGLNVNGGILYNHEVAYISEDNKQVYINDANHYLQKNIYGGVSFTFRRNIFNIHYLQLSFNDYKFYDTLLHLNPDFISQDHLQYFTIDYLFRSDHRDIKAYPLNGYYFDIEAVKNGLGILKEENVDVAYIHMSVRKFWKLHKRWYFAGEINSKVSSGSFQPYFFERGLGYGNDFVRSYEYYVVDGQNYVLLKSNIKYELVPTHVKNLKFIPYKKFSKFFYAFYLNWLIDAGYVGNRQATGSNNLSNRPLMGTGLGLDFVTYYDKVIRFEYSINKMGQSNFFLHFVAPI